MQHVCFVCSGSGSVSKALHSTCTHIQAHTHSLARQWRQDGVWSRKPSGWRKWRSPPSSLLLTLLINITKAYSGGSHHKVTSCSGFNKFSTVRKSEICPFFPFATALAVSDALQPPFFQLELYAPATAPLAGELLLPFTGCCPGIQSWFSGIFGVEGKDPW